MHRVPSTEETSMLNRFPTIAVCVTAVFLSSLAHGQNTAKSKAATKTAKAQDSTPPVDPNVYKAPVFLYKTPFKEEGQWFFGTPWRSDIGEQQVMPVDVPTTLSPGEVEAGVEDGDIFTIKFPLTRPEGIVKPQWSLKWLYSAHWVPAGKVSGVLMERKGNREDTVIYLAPPDRQSGPGTIVAKFRNPKAPAVKANGAVPRQYRSAADRRLGERKAARAEADQEYTEAKAELDALKEQQAKERKDLEDEHAKALKEVQDRFDAAEKEVNALAPPKTKAQILADADKAFEAAKTKAEETQKAFDKVKSDLETAQKAQADAQKARDDLNPKTAVPPAPRPASSPAASKTAVRPGPPAGTPKAVTPSVSPKR
jgi:chemotaxis protein histidine kinase CheA